jgi:hypothetical protein
MTRLFGKPNPYEARAVNREKGFGTKFFLFFVSRPQSGRSVGISDCAVSETTFAKASLPE